MQNSWHRPRGLNNELTAEIVIQNGPDSLSQNFQHGNMLGAAGFLRAFIHLYRWASPMPPGYRRNAAAWAGALIGNGDGNGSEHRSCALRMADKLS